MWRPVVQRPHLLDVGRSSDHGRDGLHDLLLRGVRFQAIRLLKRSGLYPAPSMSLTTFLYTSMIVLL